MSVYACHPPPLLPWVLSTSCDSTGDVEGLIDDTVEEERTGGGSGEGEEQGSGEEEEEDSADEIKKKEKRKRCKQFTHIHKCMCVHRGVLQILRPPRINLLPFSANIRTCMGMSIFVSPICPLRHWL